MIRRRKKARARFLVSKDGRMCKSDVELCVPSLLSYLSYTEEACQKLPVASYIRDSLNFLLGLCLETGVTFITAS